MTRKNRKIMSGIPAILLVTLLAIAPILIGCDNDHNGGSLIVQVNPSSSSLERGATLDFVAIVTGGNNPPQTVTWSVSGHGQPLQETNISADGRLTIGTNETVGRNITITATSVYNTWASGSATVTVTGINAPTQPNTPTAVALSATEIRISWTSATDRSFRLERANASIGPWSPITTLQGVWGTQSFYDTVLPNTTLFYRIIAINNAGESLPSGSVSATSSPLTPVGVTATPQVGAILISWNNVPGATHYRVETRTGSWWDTVAGAAAVTGTSFTHSGLSSWTSRQYRVIAINSAGVESNPSAETAWVNPL